MISLARRSRGSSSTPSTAPTMPPGSTAACPASRRSPAAPMRPCTRAGPGPSANMPASRPPKNPTPSTAATSPRGRRASASPSISPPTAATTATIRASPATSAWRASRSTRVEDMKLLFDGIPLDRDVGQHDDERRGAAGHGLLHRRRRGAGRAARQAHRHDPERHPERVRGPQHLHLPARTLDADRQRHHRLLRRGDAEVQLDLDQRLSHARGRGDGGAGARLHARRRHGICPLREGRRARHRRFRAAPQLLLRHRHEPVHGGREAARRAHALAPDHDRPRREERRVQAAAHPLPDERRQPDRAGPLQQHHPHHDRGAGGGARRHAVAAHQQLRRSDRAADRFLARASPATPS